MILDPTCGNKMFWIDKNNESVIFGDIRRENYILCDGRSTVIHPDIQLDFTHLPFVSSQFEMVVFDPPHLLKIGDRSWTYLKYGRLPKNWKEQLSRGFSECFRVLSIRGILIFKWNETQIKVSEVIELAREKPLFGHPRVGKTASTHWLCFKKSNREITDY